MRKLALAVLVGLFAGAPVGAAPNWLGQTGLLLTPTADALDNREWNVAFHHISNTANTAVGNLGLARGLEAGILFFDRIGGRGDSEVTGQAKYRLLTETERSVGLAIGWWDVADRLNSTPYGVASKRVGGVGERALRLHVGGGGGVYDGIFAGADLQIQSNLLAMLEYDGNDINGGVRWGLPQGFRVDLGFVSEEFGVGASYNVRF